MKNSLVSLFDQVTIDSQATLDPVDRQACIAIQEAYDLLMENLTQAETWLIKMGESIPALNPATVADSGRYIETNYDERKDWTAGIAFSTAYGLKYLKKAPEEAQKNFVATLLDYFAKKYNLDLDSLSSLPSTNWLSVVEAIQNHIGGDLTQVGIRNLIKSFQQQFPLYRWKEKYIELKGKVLTIQSVYLQENYCNNMSLRNKSTHALLLALNYQETGSITLSPCIQDSFPLNYNEALTYGSFREATPQCNVFAGFRYFKNRRLDLHFYTEAQASAFYETFYAGQTMDPAED